METTKEQNYTRHISAVISNEDYEILKNLSHKERISMGSVLRKLISEYKKSAEQEATKQQEMAL